MTRPGTWQRLHTDEGWLLRLLAPTGDVILTSEVKKSKADLGKILERVGFTALPPDTMDVDLRVGKNTSVPERHHWFIAECEDCDWSVFDSVYEQRSNYVGRHRLATGHRVVMREEGADGD